MIACVNTEPVKISEVDDSGWQSNVSYIPDASGVPHPVVCDYPYTSTHRRILDSPTRSV